MVLPSFNRKDRASADTLRLLAADMVEKAQSGHPGLPLGAAPMAYVLWSRFLRHDPSQPLWPNRDRFILSAGHGSALLYAWLHLAGYLKMDDLHQFRQWGSLTPGHPERGHTPGVEASTGPLGHGLAMGVGLAIAEKMLAARFNRDKFPLFDHYIYALVSDGDLMEGVSAEAASLAGTLGLGNIVYLYDDNQISIEGRTDLAFTEDVRGRFLAYGWQVIPVVNGEDLAAIYQAIDNARQETEKPSLIMVKTKLGAGSPKQDSPKAHGEPLGAEALRATKEFYQFSPDESFAVDPRVYEHFKKLGQPHQQARLAWEKMFEEYGRLYPDLAAELQRRLAAELPEGCAQAIEALPAAASEATRVSSGRILNALAPLLPELVGGSADLAPSNKSALEGLPSFSAVCPAGRNIHFGVREEAMGAIVNGLALSGAFIPYGATFLVFSDFARPALRLAALMKLKTIFIFTHDSIGVGEDGPTHQPVEQLASLRAISGLTVIRPASFHETAAAWLSALKAEGPTVLALSRQNLPQLSPEEFPALLTGPARGGYILSEAVGAAPQAIIIGTGSELSLALEAQKILAERGLAVRVVSLPSWELFEAQPEEYRLSVLPPEIKRRVSVEAGLSLGWERYVGSQGRSLSVDSFGHSAPAGELFKRLGFSAENLAALVEATA